MTEMNSKDYMVRATAADGMIRAFAATTKNLVEEARARHNMSPVATAALGRLMSATVMMGWELKSETDLITLQIGCAGPIKGLLATADNKGNVKGYVDVPDVMLPANAQGKIDVGGALDQGVLSVIRDTGLKEPYVGQTILISGEIAEDLAYYYSASEQIPSSVALGVLMNHDNTVRQAGGYIIQLMPGCSDEMITELEDKLKSLDSMTTMLNAGLTPEDVLEKVLGEFGLEINDKAEAGFYCNCSKEKVAKVLLAVGEDQLKDIIAEDKPIELVCHFCGEKYEFTIDEVKAILNKGSK